MTIPHKVTYAIDSLDPNPIVMRFDSEWEAIEWATDEIARRVNFSVEHSPCAVDESDLNSMFETESSLCRIERA